MLGHRWVNSPLLLGKVTFKNMLIIHDRYKVDPSYDIPCSWFSGMTSNTVTPSSFLVVTSLPTGHTTLLRRWMNVNGVDSTSQQRRVPSGSYLWGSWPVTLSHSRPFSRTSLHSDVYGDHSQRSFQRRAPCHAQRSIFNWDSLQSDPGENFPALSRGCRIRHWSRIRWMHVFISSFIKIYAGLRPSLMEMMKLISDLIDILRHTKRQFPTHSECKLQHFLQNPSVIYKLRTKMFFYHFL